MKRTSLCIVALAALVCASAAGAQSAGSPPKGEPGPGRMVRVQKLQLSETQKSQLREKRFAAAHRRIELRAKMAEARLHLRELMSAEKLDEAAIRAQARVVGELQGQVAQQRIEDRLATLSVLTPEQRKTLHEMRPGMRWMHRAGGGMGGPGMGRRQVRILRFGGGEGDDGENMEMLRGALPGGPGAEHRQVRVIRRGSGARVEVHGAEPGDEPGPEPGDVRIVKLGEDGPDEGLEALGGPDGTVPAFEVLADVFGAGDEPDGLDELDGLDFLDGLDGSLEFMFGPGSDTGMDSEEVL